MRLKSHIDTGKDEPRLILHRIEDAQCRKCGWQFAVFGIPETPEYEGAKWFCPHCGQGETRAFIGALGLPFTVAGEILQAFGSCLIDRGFNREDIIRRVKEADEMGWWDMQGGRAVDAFAAWLDLPGAFPEEVKP